MATFTYKPDYSASKQIKPRVTKFQFGDGYEQRQADGLNNKLQEWSVTFKRNNTDMDAIDAFLLARGAVEAFNWTTPKDYAGVFICDDWNNTIEDVGWQSITCTFREVPETAAA